MKEITLFLALILTFQSFSQIRRIDNADWLLHNLIINSEDHLNPIESEGNQILTSFGVISGMNQYSLTSICDNTGVDHVYDQNDSSFTITSVGISLGGCEYNEGVTPSEVLDVQFKFANFFNNNGDLSGVFSYDIVLENLDSPRTLTITSPNGDMAIFHHSEYLNTNKFSKLSFKIYPNPVQNELFISSENNLNNHKVQIFDIIGKLKISKELSNTNSINVESLLKGVYILRIKDDSGNTTTKKFIK